MSLRSFFFKRRHKKACRDLARDVERTKRSGASAIADRAFAASPSSQSSLPVPLRASIPLREREVNVGRKRKHGDGLRVCRCGQTKHPNANNCRDCYQPLWRPDQDASLRELIAAGWEYTRIARKIKRTASACLSRARLLGVSHSRAVILENRKRGRERFYANPAKVARRMKRLMKTFTPDERAVRAEELRQRNIAGTTGLKGRHHTPEVCERIRAAHLGRVMSPETRAKISAARKAYWAAKRDGGQAAYRAALLADKAHRHRANDDEQQRLWCAQCDRQVSCSMAAACASPFCKAKEMAA